MKLEIFMKKLKTMTTQQGVVFADVFDFFLKHVLENPTIKARSRPYTKHDELYQAMVQRPLQQIDPHLTVLKVQLTRIKKFDFIDGLAFVSDGSLASLYFFEDIYVGILQYHLQGTGHYFRLSGFMSQEKPEGVAAPFSSSTLQ